MSVSVHNLQAERNHQILEEIAAAHNFSIFVQHRGRWIRGCRMSSCEQAVEQAKHVFQRSGLPVDVRRKDGQSVFAINACESVVNCG